MRLTAPWCWPGRIAAEGLPRLGQVLLLLLLLPLLCAFDPFRSSNRQVEEGNSKLAAGKVKEALEHYQRAARELPDEPGVQYNLGIAHFRLGQLEPARQALLRASTAADAGLRGKAFYNLGNVQLEQKRYQDAVNAYRRALQLRPGHRPTQWNLELALRRLREEEEKKKKEQEKQDKKDKKDKKDQKQDQNKDQKKDQKDQNKDQQQDQKQDQSKKQQPKQDRKKDQKQARQDQKKQRPPEMDQVLDALDRNDKNLQRKRARQVMGGDLPRPVKDW